jgi:DNA/RNA-binding domain of Phe-tRNA-synthetase-like protein
MKMKISENIKSKCPNLRLGVITCSVQISDNRADLWSEIDAKILELENMETTEISKLPTIAATRKAYKALGKDPARYRPSAEALLRRVVKGKGLYKINNVVDLLNLVSIATGFSIGGYDADKIEGEVTLGIGEAEEPYEGIGRGTLNIEFLPTFRDAKSAFGTPTSDSVRTSVTAATKQFQMIILDFASLENLAEAMELSVDLLRKFGDAENIEREIVD